MIYKMWIRFNRRVILLDALFYLIGQSMTTISLSSGKVVDGPTQKEISANLWAREIILERLNA